MTYTLKPKNIPLNEDYDVIVVGGGPSGCTAAAASAREGKKTLLIEATSSLGGMGTNGLVPAWCPFSDREKLVYRGLAEKVFNDTKAGMRHIKDGTMDWVAIDAEQLKRVYDDLVSSHGADVLFNTQLSDVDVEDGRVKTIIVSNKEGLSAYRASVYVDTTGDADLTAFAGGRFTKGDGDAEELQPATHCFILSNVDMYSFPLDPRIHGANLNSPIHQILKDKKYPLIPDGHIIGTVVGPGTVGFNAGHIWKVDNTQPKTVSQALMLGRKIAATFRDALAEYLPKTYGNAHLVSTGALLGIRETRRIEGDYELTVNDYFERKTFGDEIARNSYFIDVHSNAAAAKAKGKLERYKKGESHGIPYRCLTPKTLKNVLVAGRSISTERLVQGSVRVMPVCLAMGEAAGTAAGFAVDAGGDVRNFDIQALRQRLLENGAYIK